MYSFFSIIHLWSDQVEFNNKLVIFFFLKKWWLYLLMFQLIVMTWRTTSGTSSLQLCIRSLAIPIAGLQLQLTKWLVWRGDEQKAWPRIFGPARSGPSMDLTYIFSRSPARLKLGLSPVFWNECMRKNSI